MIIATALFAVAAAAAPSQATSPAPTAPTVSGPVVVLETSMGDIRIALDEQKAPITVKNFLAYVRAGHYEGTVFHRVIPGFMVQGGGMDAAMKEKVTRAPIKNEAANKLRNDRGTVAMARTAEPNSATAQFFINLKNNASLDYGVGGPGYAVFGTVIEGMDVVDRMAAVRTTSKGPHQDVPVTAVVIKHARVEAPAAPPAAAPAESIPRPAPPRPASMPREN
jgi:peptidyl-prolyl cis-trans isomerase A (cyclophilin A)